MPIPLEESLEPCWVFPSKISGIREGSIPLPLSDMVKTAPLFFLDTFTPIGAVLPEWRMAFHQIDEYLFDQGGIHGNNQHFLRNRNIYNGIGKTLANPTDSLHLQFLL